MESVTFDDRRSVPRTSGTRRVNQLGRWIVAVHQKHFLPELIPALWILVIASSVLQVLLVACGK